MKGVILLTGETTHRFPTAEPAVLRDLQRPGETGAKQPLEAQLKDHRVSKGALKALPELLPQVAVDPSPLLPQVAEVLLGVLLEVLLGLLPWMAADPLLLLPRVAEALTEVLSGLLKGVAVVVVLAATGCQRGNQNVRQQSWLLLLSLSSLRTYDRLSFSHPLSVIWTHFSQFFVRHFY